LSAEVGLALLIVALYLLDSLLLLRIDEAVLVCRGLEEGEGRVAGDVQNQDGRRWRAAFGAQGFKLAGREPWLANPWLPHQPVYRLGWHAERVGLDPGRAAAPAAEGRGFEAGPGLRRLHQLAPAACISWLLLLVGIPVTLLGPFGMRATLAAVVLLYLNIAAALAFTWHWRSDLGLNGRAFALLAFECLACAPYSANLVRRLSWSRRADEDFADAAHRLLAPPALQQVRRECLSRIDEQIEAEPESGARAAALLEARSHLAAQIAAAAANEDPA
jgi:hypothetical protein